MATSPHVNQLRGLCAATCLTVVNLTIARIKATRTRRNLAARRTRGEIAQLLRSGQAAHIYDTKIVFLIKEENTVAAYDLIDYFCHSIVSQFSVIETQRYCPPELKEPIASLIYAAPRCADLPELTELKDMLTTKYGKEFATAANELRRGCGVSREIIELLSMHPPSENLREKLMKDICLQNNIEWHSEWLPEPAIKSSTQNFQIKERDEENIKTQQVPFPRTSHLSMDQDMNLNQNRGARHRQDPIFREQEIRANVHSSDDMAEFYHPAAGSEYGSLPRHQDTKIKKKVSEGIKDHYDPRTGLKYGSFAPSIKEDEEATRANRRGANKSYKPEFIPIHGKGTARDNVQASEGREEMHKPELNGRRTSLLEEEQESGRPLVAPFGRHKLAAYKEEIHEERAEYIMQHPDEISDSGSDIFVSIEEDDVALSHKEGAPTMSRVARSSFQGAKQENTCDQMGRETDLDTKGYLSTNFLRPSNKSHLDTNPSPYHGRHTDNQDQKHFPDRHKQVERHSFQDHKEKLSEKASNRNPREGPDNQNNGPDIVNEEHWVDKLAQESSHGLSDPLIDDEFASTAKAIAAEAARLAVLNYAKQYSRSSSSSKDVGDLTAENVEDVIFHSRQEGSDTEDDNGDLRMKGKGCKASRPSKTTHSENANVGFKRYETGTRSEGKINSHVDNRRGHEAVNREGPPYHRHTFPSFDLEKEEDENVNVGFKHYETDTGSEGKINSGREAVNWEGPPYHRHTFPSFDLEKEDDACPYFDEFEPPCPNKMPQREKSHKSSRPPPDEDHEDRWLSSTDNADNDKRRPTRAPQAIDYNNQEYNKMSGGIRSPVMHDKFSELPRWLHHDKQHQETQDYFEKGSLGTSSLQRGPTNRAEVHIEKTPPSPADVKGNDYGGMSERLGWGLQERDALRKNNISEVTLEEKRRRSAKSFDSQDPASRSSKMIHQHSEKGIVDEVQQARWHGEEVSSNFTQHKKESFVGSKGNQKRPQEPATVRSKPYTEYRNINEKSPGQHDQDPDLLPLYKAHGQVDDVLNRVPSKPTSVRHKPQHHQEDIQDEASNYNSYVQKNEVYEGHQPPAKQSNPDRPNRQAKYPGKLDSLPTEKEPQQNESLNQKAHHPFAAGQHRYDEEDASGLSPNRLHKPFPKHHEEEQRGHTRYDRELRKPGSSTSDCPKKDEFSAAHMSPYHASQPPRRKPPPLPERYQPKGADCDLRHSMPGNQKKQAGLLQEDVEAPEQKYSEKLDRRAAPPMRPPPPIPPLQPPPTRPSHPVTARATEKERPKQESREPARPLPESPTWPSSSSGSSEPHNVPCKPPSPTSTSGSSERPYVARKPPSATWSSSTSGSSEPHNVRHKPPPPTSTSGSSEPHNAPCKPPWPTSTSGRSDPPYVARKPPSPTWTSSTTGSSEPSNVVRKTPSPTWSSSTSGSSEPSLLTRKPTSPTRSSSTSGSSEPPYVARKSPSPSCKPESSAPASSPTKPAPPKMGDIPGGPSPVPAPAASKKSARYPHVDDIAANLEALRRARGKA